MNYYSTFTSRHDPTIYQTEDEMFDDVMDQEFLAVSSIAKCGTLGSMNDIGFGYGDPWKRDPIPHLIQDITRPASRKRKAIAKLRLKSAPPNAHVKERADKISKIMLRHTLDWAFETVGISD